MKRIKQTNILMAILVICLLTNCTKDNDDVEPEATLAGKWNITKVEYYKGNVLDKTENIVQDNTSCPDYIEFKNDGTFLEIENDFNCVESYRGEGKYTYDITTTRFAGTANFVDDWQGETAYIKLSKDSFTYESIKLQQGVELMKKFYFIKIN